MGEQSGHQVRTAVTLVATATIVLAAGGWPAVAAQTARPAAASQTIVRGWGDNDNGAVGNGSGALDVLTPARVKLPKGITISSIRAGCDHSVALTSTGSVLAWGGNAQGEVGDGTTKTRKVPVDVRLPKGTKVTAVRAGCDHSIALTKAGTVLAWGLNNLGQLGDGTKKNRRAPVKVRLPKGTKIKAISAGCDDGFALATTGKLYAWGHNFFGQLGDGTEKNRTNPVAVKLPKGTKVTGISAGCSHTMALTSTGLWGWGHNNDGQLGTGDMKSTDLPVLIVFLFRGQGPGTITSVFAGCFHTIALFSRGAVLAWGGNNAGQLGNGTTTPNSLKPVSVMLPAGVKVKAISAGCDNGYALTSTGKVYAWGADDRGELGNGSGSTTGISVPALVHLPVTSPAVAIGAGPGAQHAFAISG